MALASGSERFRVPKTSSEETGLVNDTVPPSTKYKNKWAVNIFAEWQSLREVKVPVLDCGGVFKDYELHKVCALSADIAAMDVLSLNYWLSKFVMEVAKKSGERYPPKSVYAHSLRVTCVSSLFNAGVDDKLIRVRSGHRSNALFQYEKPTEENLSKVSNILGPSTSVVSTSTCTTIEKREEQDESIALKDVVFQKGNCTTNVTLSKKE